VSHIHIPDGVLPVWLVAAGWVVALALVFVAAKVSERADIRRKVPLLGVVAALVLVSMSSEIVPLAYHVNLTVVAGVLLGPWLAIIASFIVEVVLAMLGHGGVTVIGLNTLMIAAEMVLGWALFRLAVRLLGRRGVRWKAGVVTVLTLATTTTLLVGLVAIAGGGAAATRETGALDPTTLRFSNPFAGGIVSINTLRGEGAGAKAAAGGAATSAATGAASPASPATGALSVRRFAAVVYTLGPIGWLIEALITAAVLGYVARVRPSLVFGGALSERGYAVPDHTTTEP
jgi:ABC-type Co2+ transport system permease subunit